MAAPAPKGRSGQNISPIQKVFDCKWHNSALLHSESCGSPSLRRLYRAAETACMDTRLALSMHPYNKPQTLPPLSSPKEKGREGISGMSQGRRFILR
jgi:hypothetical protein